MSTESCPSDPSFHCSYNAAGENILVRGNRNNFPAGNTDIAHAGAMAGAVVEGGVLEEGGGGLRRCEQRHEQRKDEKDVAHGGMIPAGTRND